MPKTKRTRRAILVEDDDDEKEGLLPDEIQELEKQQAVEEWLGDFQSRFTDQPVRVLVEKFEEGEWSICRKYPLGTFDHEAVRDEFGGGRYRATLFDPNGKYIKGGRNNFKFAAPAVKKDGDAKPANPLADPAIAMMFESMKQQSAMLLGITQSMISANAGKAGGGLTEMVEAMKGIQALSPKNEKPLDNFKETLGIMKLVKEVTGDGDGDSKGGFMSEVREFLELAPLLKEKMPVLKAALAPGGLPTAPAQPIPPGETPSMDPLSQKIIALVPRFVAAAKSNAPIETWSDHLIDVLEDDLMPVLVPHMKGIYGPLIDNADDVYDVLIKFAKDPAARDKIYTSVPPLAPYKPWCDQVIDAALKTLTDEETGGNVVMEAVGRPENGSSEHDPA